ncbi:MAG: 3-hydroxyacyl-CoA dehydrogenase/enoyl-CoA hydratase family protein [Micropruina sp.]
MATQISNAVVIGAGTMGAGIAAQLANGGAQVTLLDRASEGDDRSALARAGVARQLAGGGFMLPEFAERVTPGNVVDDLAALAGAEWIIEAVFEDVAVKAETYRLIEAHRSPGSLVSSNTSTIPLGVLLAGQSAGFVRDFTITHFFNPPRQMELLELVAGPQTDPAVVRRVREAGEEQLGKLVLDCRDTPGFVANRIGNFWMAVAATEALRRGLDVETADAAMASLGVPKTGVFGLFDLVGLNLVRPIWSSFLGALPRGDAYHRFDITAEPVFVSMIEAGLIGRRGPGGFYRRRNEAGAAVDEALDLQSLTYRPRRPAASGAEAAEYARAVLAELVDYCRVTGPEITGELSAIDQAMELGYGWRQGPLALANQSGLGPFTLPVAQTRPIIAENDSAAITDLGEGLARLELRTKMNVCDPGVLAMVEQAAQLGTDGVFRALVIGSDNPRAFSAGANLNTFAELLERNDANELRAFTVRGQQAFAALRRAPFPVVAAARGVALGGGCELMLAADRVVAHAELHAGFPERKVGLIPAWGGVTQSLARSTPEQAFELTSSSAVSGSAFEARVWGLLRPDDPIVMNSRRVLPLAASTARDMIEGYQPPTEAPLTLHDPATGALDEGWREASPTDRTIVAALAAMLTATRPGETVSQDELMRREVETALSLVVQQPHQERMRHMIATNKPLAN